MLDKLEAIKERFDEVSQLIVDPEIISDMKQYIQLNKEYKDLQPIMEAHKAYKNLLSNIETAKEMLKDEEMKEMAKMELDELQPQQEVMEEEIKVLLIPKDPADSKNAVVEIRAGAGGDEASIFTGDLYRMYLNYASSKGWKTELVDAADGTSGGYKEIIFNVNGEDVYGMLKFESGVHRVQRVPQTETQGRVHTSAASVVVMPEAEVNFTLDSDTLARVRKAAGVLGHSELSISNTQGAVRLSIADISNATSNLFSIDVEGTYPEGVNFNFIMNVNNLKVIDEDFHVAISSKLISQFTSTQSDIEYFIALEKSSTYGA